MESTLTVKECINRGNFIREFQSIPDFINGCNYRLDFAEGCVYDCSYCFLQDYLGSGNTVVIFNNWDDLTRELKEKYDSLKGETVSLGVLNDSFAPDIIKEQVIKFLDIGKLYPEINFELRTKSSLPNPEILKKIPDNFSIVYSMNSKKVHDYLEKGTLSINRRIDELEKLIMHTSLSVGLVFDPIIIYPEWLNDYTEVLDLIKNSLPESRIAFWGMGLLRLTPKVAERLRTEGRKITSLIFNPRFIPGNKDKLVYPFPDRLQVYKKFISKISKRFHEPRFRFYMEYKQIPEILNLKQEGLQDYV